MKAKYGSLTEAAKKLIRIKNVLQNEVLHLNLQECIQFYDNQAAIAFFNLPFENQKTKYIHIKYRFHRNVVFDKIFELAYFASKLNLADSFTEPQVKEKLIKFWGLFFKGDYKFFTMLFILISVLPIKSCMT